MRVLNQQFQIDSKQMFEVPGPGYLVLDSSGLTHVNHGPRVSTVVEYHGGESAGQPRVFPGPLCHSDSGSTLRHPLPLRRNVMQRVTLALVEVRRHP